MTSEVRVFTPEQTSHRILCQTMKASVKTDALAIRAHNAITGKARDTAWQSIRSELKAKARARHLVYGFVRGHDLDRMEGPKSKKVSPWYLQKAWKEAQATAIKEFAEFTYTNALIEKHVNG